MTQRTLKLTLSYDGTAYCGWQVQPNGPTIQQAMERAFATIFGARISITASGRTDAGVHARGQVASCELPTEMSLERICRALNGNLPADIRVLSVEEAPAGFHAIRDAIRKRYRYCLDDAPIHDVFRRNFVWHVRAGRLDVVAMQQAARALIGTHDFRSFQAAGSDRKTTVRTIFALDVQRCEATSGEIVIEIEADGFLYNMVRNIVGSLVEIGLGNQSVHWLEDVLAARDRTQAGRTAPPEGLLLLHVTYASEGQRGPGM